MKTQGMKKPALVALIALAASAGSVAAHADSVYSSESSWASAVSGTPTTFNFEATAAPFSGTTDIYGTGPGASIVVNGVTFAIGATGTMNLLTIDGDNTYYSAATLSAQPGDGVSPADLLITLPDPVTAFGFDFGGIYAPGTATVTLSDLFQETVSVPSSPDLTFFGITAPGGVTSVDITLPGGQPTYGLAIEDFSYGTASVAATPEPSSLMLLGSGLVALAGMARRKLSAKA